MILYFILYFLIRNSAAEECRPMDFKLNIPTTIKLFVKAKLSVEHEYHKCSKNATYGWKLTLWDDKKASFNVFDKNETKMKENEMNLIKAGEATPFYQHLWNLTVTIYPLDDVLYTPSSISKTFLVVPNEMKLELKGGPNRTHIHGCGSIFIDGTDSKDPSFQGKVHPMHTNEIDWKCNLNDRKYNYPKSLVLEISPIKYSDQPVLTCKMTVTRQKRTPYHPETASISQSINIIYPSNPPNLTLKCVDNCRSSDSFKKTILQWRCMSHCLEGLTVSECLNPKATLYTSPIIIEGEATEENKVEYERRAFPAGSTITFTAIMGNGSASLNLTYLSRNPKLNITCIRNCEFYDVALPLTLAVTCEGRYCEDITYAWKVLPDIKGVTGSSNRSDLTIPEDTMNDGDTVTVQVTAWDGNATFTTRMRKFVPTFSFNCTIEGYEKCKEFVEPENKIKVFITCNCSEKFNFKISPNPKKGVIVGYDSIVIPPYTYTYGDKINITAYHRKYNTTFEIKFTETPPEMFINCTLNCANPANTHMETILVGVCPKCRTGGFNWTVSDIDEDTVKSWSTNMTLTIPARTFNDNQSVSISLSNEYTNTTFKTTFVRPKANINLECEDNCLPSNPNFATIFNVTCKGEFGVCSDLEYIWELNPKPSKAIEQNGERNSILKIIEGSYSDEDKVNITVHYGEASASKELTYVEPLAELTLVCTDNCDPTHTDYATTLQVKCNKNCEHLVYNWNITVVSDTFNWLTSVTFSDDKSIITINGETFKGGDTKSVTVSSGKASASLTLNFVEILTKLKISCKPRCNEIHNPMNSLLVWVNCSKHCVDIENHTWTFKNEPIGFEFKKSIIVQKNYESILILPEAFPSGTNVTVYVDSIASEKLRFLEPTIDLDINCNDDCTKLNTFIPTNLTAHCMGRCTNDTFYSWVLEPPPTNWSLNVINAPYNRYLIINPKTYKEGDDVNVTLSIRKTSVSKKIHFFHVEAKLSLRCLKSCSAANPFEDVEIGVKCKENCGGLEYVWGLETTKTEFNFSRDITLGPGNKTLTISRNVFKNNDRIVVTADTGRGKAQGVIHFLVPKSKIYITCIENCKNDEANPLRNVILNVTCDGTCYDDKFSWNFSPKPDDWSYIDLSYPNMTIIGKSYRDKGSVRIVVSNYQNEDQKDIHFIEPTPNISIYCPDCSNANPEKPLTFKAICKECFDGKYSWEITPQLRSFNWSKNVIFGGSNESMTIVENTFNEMENVAVLVKYGKGEALVQFKYNYRIKFITIACIQNCNMSNPYQKVVLNASCMPDCGMPEYTWNLSPWPKGFVWNRQVKISSGTEVFTLAGNTFSTNITAVAYAHTGPFNGTFTINFVVRQPDVILKVIDYKGFNPKAQVKFAIDCLAFCERIRYRWKIEPSPDDKESLLAQEFTLTIRPNTYAHNDNVTITVFINDVERITQKITFIQPNLIGNCNVEPSEGQAGVTKFFVDCYDFNGTPFFYIQQDYGTHEDEFVVLSYGYGGISEAVILDHEGTITLRSGEDWFFHQTINISIKVTEFPIEKLRVILFGNGSESFPMIVKRKDPFKTIQLASAICTALHSNASISHEYIGHVISGIISASPYIEPTQTLLLIFKLALKFSTNPLTASLLMEATQIASTAIFAGRQYNVPPYGEFYYEMSARIILKISSTLYSNMYKSLPKNDYMLPSPDYSTYTDFVLPAADVVRHAESLTVAFLAAINQVPVMLHKSAKRKMGYENIYVLLHDEEVFGDASPTILYDMVMFKINPFWWANLDTPINTELIQVVAHEGDSTFLSQMTQVDLKIIKRPSRVIQGTILELTTVIIRLREKSLFTAHFVYYDAPYEVSIGSCMPKTDKFEDKLYIINKNTKLSVVSEKSYLYIGISPHLEDKIKYKINVMAQECFSWTNKELAWRRDLCNVSDMFNESFIQCRCQQASYFGGRTYAPKIRYVLNKKVDDSHLREHRDFTVLLLILVSSGLFLCLLFIAHQQDLIFYNNNKVHFLEDNVPGDKELYLLLITTGISNHAGTSANVAIKINGKLGQSRVHVLSSETSHTLKRNREDYFAIYAPKFLGEIKSIKLWHNSCGSSPHWYCESVIIKHPRSHKEYLFEIHRWFSLIYGDGTTRGTFRVSNLRKPKFSWKLRESFRQSHHIFSFFTKRPRPGSSKELVLIGFASCCTIVMAVAVLLQKFKGRDTFSFVWMGCAAALSSIPVAMILGWLFRNSR